MASQAYEKSLGFGAKQAGASVTPEMLEKINRFALEPLTAEQVYVRKFLLAHNAIDRDRERFPESLLDDFAATLPGKSFLFGHRGRDFLPMGLWFDAQPEEMSPEKFKALTGETPRLPETVGNVKALWGWMYAVKTAENEETRLNIDGGVYRHVSIGFMAADLVAVKKEANGPTLYWEYVGPGEATEGSLVWLGAQPGATAQKAAKDHDNKGDRTMKNLKVLVGKLLGKSFGDDVTEEAVYAEIETAIKGKDTEIATLTGKVKALEPQAAMGKAYQEELATDYVRMKVALGEADADTEKQAGVKEFAVSMPIDHLKTEVKHLQARMEKAFPGGQLDGGDPNENRGKGAADENPLIPKK